MNRAIKIYVRKLQAKGLLGKDMSGKSDPFIVFQSVPPELLASTSEDQRKTHVKVQTLDPEWLQREVPTLRPAVAVDYAKETLHNCTLILSFYDRDRLIVDTREALGTAAVSLSTKEKNGNPLRYTINFDVPVCLGGQSAGRVRGTLLVCCEGQEELCNQEEKPFPPKDTAKPGPPETQQKNGSKPSRCTCTVA